MIVVEDNLILWKSYEITYKYGGTEYLVCDFQHMLEKDILCYKMRYPSEMFLFGNFRKWLLLDSLG